MWMVITIMQVTTSYKYREVAAYALCRRIKVYLTRIGTHHQYVKKNNEGRVIAN